MRYADYKGCIKNCEYDKRIYENSQNISVT